ncbi:MAG: C25 family cysteine peptidase [Chloroflexi bacterium]|nr:C25 family cysteine peptidase [Chloroflexota bacterium]
MLTIAATSLTLSSQQEPFATRFIQALLDPDIQRIGDAFQAAKLSLDVNNAGLREISDTFALFGDPSARILRPEE